MAIFLLEVKVFARDKGARITRAAAYRAGERIRDERTRELYTYTERNDVAHKEIVLPSEYAQSAEMDWARDRSALWNAAEHTDRRNARLGREVLLGLPAELTAPQRTELARKYAQELADKYHCGVDTTIHMPRPGSDSRNYHAHLLMTTRRVTPSGLGPRTTLEMSGTERHAAGLGKSKNDLLLMRERWAQVTNEALREAGLNVRVDHRSLKARGIDREPMPHIPQKIRYFERVSHSPTVLGSDIRRKHRERVEAREKGGNELARVLTQQKNERRERTLLATPKQVRWSALTREERNQRRRTLYAQRPMPTPEQRSVQRWLAWRKRNPEQVQSRQQDVGRNKPAHAPTAGESVRNWLAYREALQESRPPREPDTDRHKKRDRSRDYELEP